MCILSLIKAYTVVFNSTQIEICFLPFVTHFVETMFVRPY
jgi:hypothetical protein